MKRSPEKALRSRSPLREPLGGSLRGPSGSRSRSRKGEVPFSFPRTPFGRAIVSPTEDELFLSEVLDWDSEILREVLKDYKFGAPVIANAYLKFIESPVEDEKDFVKILEAFEKEGELDFSYVPEEAILWATRANNVLGVSHLLLNLKGDGWARRDHESAIYRSYRWAQVHGYKEIEKLLEDFQ